MNFEDLQGNWQRQDAGRKPVDVGALLLKEVRRNRLEFQATVFWCDTREVGVALYLAVVFGRWGWAQHNWAHYPVAGACLGVALFILGDRIAQWRKRPPTGSSLRDCAEGSLREVRHQIWLLENVFWWYLLPLALALGLFIAVSMAHARTRAEFIGMCVYAVFCGLLNWGIYAFNQWAVRVTLEPRRAELEALLAGLD